jgi:hypothetical protein
MKVQAMTEACPVLCESQRQIVEIIANADQALAQAVSKALDDATNQAAEAMRAIGQEKATPALQYFAAVVHQRMYCLMCGADPDTFDGGDPRVAYDVIRNSQNIAQHYWSAKIEPYPEQETP